MKYDAALFLSKIELYAMITQKATELGFNVYAQNYRIDACKLAMQVCLRPQIRILEFAELRLCGMLYRGEKSTSIGLNARRSVGGRNFDCMHELIHYWYHKQASFYCIADTDNNVEWQANEGAAQFLMPYQNFVPNYCHLHDRLYSRMQPSSAHSSLISTLAKNYMVGEMSVQIRIKSLAAEIGHYADGTPIHEIKIAPPNSVSQKQAL